MTLPLLPIVQPTLPDTERLLEDFRAVLGNPKVTVGRYVKELEEAVIRLTGAKHCVAVSSCTAGLMLAVSAFDIGPGDEVILPPFTWTSTGLCVLWRGATPVFVDVEPGRFTLDPAAFERAITPRTRAVMPVTVFGVPPEIDAIEAIARRHGIRVIYDTAQGLGSTYRGRPLGGFGDVEVFSMSPTKVATSIEGGLLTTNDAALAETLGRMRDYGKAADGDIDRLGLSARQSELHAAVGLRSVEALGACVAARSRLTTQYREGLRGLRGVSFHEVPAHTTTSWNYFTLFLGPEAVSTTQAVHDALEAQGIQTKRYFYRALHHQTVFAGVPGVAGLRLPVADYASASGLALPLYSHMGDGDVARVIAAVRGVLA